MAAIQAVLHTFELLEKILLSPEIDMRALLLSQRTNRVFRQTIERSVPLQRKLYMVSALPLEKPASAPYKVTINPLLAKGIYGGAVAVHLGITKVFDRAHCQVTIRLAKMPDEEKIASAGWRRMSMCQPQGKGKLTARVRSGWRWYSVDMDVMEDTSFGEVYDKMVAAAEAMWKTS